MRIGFDARFVTARRTGLGNYCLWLLEALIRQNDGDEFVVFGDTGGDLKPLAAVDGVRLVPVPARLIGAGRAGAVAGQQIDMARLINRHELDIMHFPYYLEPALVRTPFILTIHDVDTFRAGGRHSLWTRLYHNGLTRLLARRAAALVTVSEFSREQIAHYLKISAGDIRTIVNGLSPHFNGGLAPGATGPAKATSREPVPPAGYVLYAGGLGVRKNLRRMVDAFALAADVTGADSRLVITGELAEVGQALKAYVESRGLGRRVTFTGYLPDEQMPALYRGALAAVYPSTYEGFGLPVLEAMAMGVAVITSRDSAMAEVADGRAVLVDPLDTLSIAAGIGAVLADSSLARALGERGPERAAEFTWSAAARDFNRLYAEIGGGASV
ncbi:MAG: glycosyltransferase family 4 protein [Thermoleophilia bacterium]